jgi:hypothetical protein
MRISVVLRNFSLLVALVSPALVFAQFQAPTNEELKMTADPKAPGAAAVYLNVEEDADDPIHFQSFYARIKILQEKGKELATVEVPYLHGDSKIDDIKGRTIHSDGTIIPLVGKPEDLLNSKSVNKEGDSFQVNRKVFTLPSVEVGSIIEYRYVLRYDDNHYSSPSWEIQRPYFVHKAHYSFLPFKAFQKGEQSQTSWYLEDEHQRVINTLIWWPKLPEGVTVKSDAIGRYSVDLTDIPAAPDEEWMPPGDTYLYKVFFYYKPASDAKDFWITDSKFWSKDVDKFASANKDIHEAVDGIIAPTDTDVVKAKKLYVAVQALDNTDYSRKKSESELKDLKLKEASHAEDTWKQKSGSSEDIAMLYLAMLRAASVPAYAIKVVDRARSLFDISYLSLSQLDDTLVVATLGGKDVVLDPGEKMCPFQTVSWRHSAAGGISQGPVDKLLANTPGQAYPDNKTVRVGDMTVDTQGAVTGVFRVVMTGQEALYWRQKALTNDLDEVKKQFDKELESTVPDGVEAHIDHFMGLDDPYLNLIAYVNAKGTVGTATSKRLLLPGFFFDTRGGHPFVAQEKREEPVDMHFGQEVTDQITYHLPAGFSVEGAPKDDKIVWADHAVFVDKTVPGQGQITIARMLARAFTFAKPEEYQDLRGFYQKVAAADQQQLVLLAAPVLKGN